MELNQYKVVYELYLDMEYLEETGTVDRLDEWVELAKQIFHS
jgi:hypothetical protein